MSQIVSRTETVVIYDGECPFCRSYASLMKLREVVGDVALVNARDGGRWVEALNEQGYDLNDGMAVIFGDKVYYGDDAVVFISSMSTDSSLLARCLTRLLRNKTRARIVYPVMKLGRRLTLHVLGIRPIGSSKLS
jgi:predicted DCC family thiol-disulfide oxidoreductase YuxK